MKLHCICLAALLAMAGCSSVKDSDKPSTALAGVTVLQEQLDMPGLNRKRQIRLYLPPGYATSGKRYPVLYMHDAQNLFDRKTAYAGEWNVDETMDALAKDKLLEAIVVGIDNGGDKRMTELNAWHNDKIGKPEGAQYMDFIVKVVKPMIDAKYRTLPDRANTAIMGSSMGGLISHYAVVQHADVFGKAGIFSPSYWAGGPTPDYATARPAARDARLYLLMGQNEGGEMVANVEKVFGAVKAGGHPEANVSLKVVPGGEHSEAFWSSEFRQAVLWMFAPAPAATAP